MIVALLIELSSLLLLYRTAHPSASWFCVHQQTLGAAQTVLEPNATHRDERVFRLSCEQYADLADGN